MARIDPERITDIALLEVTLNAAGAKRDSEKGRPFVERSMFSFHGGDQKHYPLPIYQATVWANSKRGEWQPPGAMDGCMRHGVCETGVDHEESARAPIAEQREAPLSSQLALWADR